MYITINLSKWVIAIVTNKELIFKGFEGDCGKDGIENTEYRRVNNGKV